MEMEQSRIDAIKEGRGRSVRDWVDNYIPGRDFTDKRTDTAVCDGWFDWFCDDKYLSGYTKGIAEKVAQIVDSPRFDADTCSVFLRQICTGGGDLFVGFGIVDTETRDGIFNVYFEGSGTQVWMGCENKFDTWEQARQYIMGGSEFFGFTVNVYGDDRVTMDEYTTEKAMLKDLHEELEEFGKYHEAKDITHSTFSYRLGHEMEDK